MKTLTQELKQTLPSGQDTLRSRQIRNHILVIGGAGILLFAIVIGAFV